MKISIVFSCLLAVVCSFPQGLQGSFSKEQQQLPESVSHSIGQIETELKGSNVAAPPGQGQQGALNIEERSSNEGNTSGEKPASVSASGESVADSYANIGGASGGIASALTATNEYGETVPPAFSSLKEDTYAYYQGHNNA